MQLKLAALALASATAVFAAEDAPAEFSLPPSSILNVLATAVPTSVLGELDNLSAISAWAYGLASSIENGQTPGWVASLPPSVKSYLYTAYVTDTGAAVTAASTAASAATTGGASTSPATATVTSASASGSSGGASASGSSAGGTSTSTGGAPAATGALAVGLTGAVGVLGLALAL